MSRLIAFLASDFGLLSAIGSVIYSLLDRSAFKIGQPLNMITLNELS